MSNIVWSADKGWHDGAPVTVTAVAGRIVTATAFCAVPGHAKGNKPYIVPLPGNNQRTTPLFLVYHGHEYLTAAGEVTRHPVRFEGYAAAEAALKAHG